MTQYFNVNNQVHVLDDGIDPAEYIKQPYTVITKAEADVMLTPPAPTAQQQRDAIQAQIDALESATHMNRFVREAMLLISVQQAQALGLTEPQLYAANIGYKKVKDLDTQIVALRTQKDAIV
ncbi:MAG: hypothetical protein PHE88_11730 [Elusimicrobia bacterium]|nr:hypothetical protein [Elusimicrobiota bacterium]